MTDRELMQQALEALEKARDELEEYEALAHAEDYNDPRLNDAITALRERLAQPEQEPVAWAFWHSDRSWHDISDTEHSAGMKPLYTTPPRREWVGLTSDEIAALWDVRHDIQGFARAIEVKLKEKNA